MIDARFIAHTLSAPVRKHTDHEARKDAARARRREREAATRPGAHVAAPYPWSLATDVHDPLHAIYLRCALAQKAARMRGDKGPTWREALAEEGIRTEEDVLAYFAKRRLP